MASHYSEVGHAKNVANFTDLIAFVIGYGTAYNPSKTALKLPALQALATASQATLTEVITKNTAFNGTVNLRLQAFSTLRALSTRLINALEATEASNEKIDDAKLFNRKMQGKRASIGASARDAQPIDPNTPAPSSISASQQSYDQLIQHFAGFISVLQSETTYTPNENDLKIPALQSKLADLNTKNTAVATAYVAVSNARIFRNKTLYKDETGLVPIAIEVKKYVKSIFGATSDEYAQIKGIEFKKNDK